MLLSLVLARWSPASTLAPAGTPGVGAGELLGMPAFEAEVAGGSELIAQIPARLAPAQRLLDRGPEALIPARWVGHAAS